MYLCLSVSMCVCVYLKPSTDFLGSAPEIEASPVDEPALSSVFWVMWAADKQHRTYFPDCEEERILQVLQQSTLLLG